MNGPTSPTNHLMMTASKGPMVPDSHSSDENVTQKSHTSLVSALIPAAAALFTSLPAEAVSGGPVPNALVAYVHYASIISIGGILMFQRSKIAPGITAEEELEVGKADLAYLVAAIVLVASGYYRTLEFGKGWEFYQHEPFFWVKISFFGLFSGLSLFPTITMLKRNIPRNQGEEVPPMSDALIKRLKSIINAEISALLSIPLTATLMARGVLYNDDFPWMVGAGLSTLALVGSSALYAKQALTWEEPNDEKFLE